MANDWTYRWTTLSILSFVYTRNQQRFSLKTFGCLRVYGELDENVPVVNFAVNQLEQEFTSDILSPLNIHFRSLRGRVFSGIGSGQFGVSLHERDRKQQEPDTNCTVVWETDGNVQLSSKAEFVVRVDSGIDPKMLGGRSGFSGGSDRTFVTVDSRGIPLQAVQAAHLHLSSKEAE